MNIGIIGSGNMGASMGKIWAAKGHKVLFSFSKDQEKLGATAAAAGPNACTDTPAGAVAFGELVLLSVPWTAVPEALKALAMMGGLIAATVLTLTFLPALYALAFRVALQPGRLLDDSKLKSRAERALQAAE